MKDEGDTALRNVGQHLSSDVASLRRIREFSIAPTWKPQNWSYFNRL